MRNILKPAVAALCGAVAVAVSASPAMATITFNNTLNGGDANYSAAVTQAEQLWQNTFSDNVTLNLTFNFQADNSFLAFTSNSLTVPSYSTFRTALVADATTATDTQALSALPTTSTINFTTRKSGATVLDNNGSANNTFLAVTRANAKAAGTLAGTDTGLDATVNVSTNAVAYDFNRADGITSTAYDVVGVIAHEIGHAMGFTSFTDNLDTTGGTGSSNDANAEVRSLDLFRRKSAGGGIDVTVAGDPYFSIDGGTTRVGNLSSGTIEGDGFQASHWENRGPGSANAGAVIGIMDPQISNGELAAITAADITAFDSIGWTPVPEPGSLALLGISVGGSLSRRRRRA